MAEFVDNSLQACGEDETNSASIHISAHFSTAAQKRESFLVIFDNGCGMNKSDISQFTILSLSHKDREKMGETPRSLRNTVKISKFGVGAKQAGFALGNRIRVVTKKREDRTVREVSLDEKLMMQKQVAGESNESVFTTTLHERDVGDVDRFLPPDEGQIPAIVREFEEHERGLDQFTYIVIRLRQKALKSMSRGFSQFCRDLSEIYHFYLHPSHLPHRIWRMDKFQQTSTFRCGGLILNPNVCMRMSILSPDNRM